MGQKLINKCVWRDGNLKHSSLRSDLANSKSLHWGILLEWQNLHEVSHTIECNSINYQDQTAMITHSHNLTHEWKRVQFLHFCKALWNHQLCTHTTSLSFKIGDVKNMGAIV
jgi:hypothetical protein